MPVLWTPTTKRLSKAASFAAMRSSMNSRVSLISSSVSECQARDVPVFSEGTAYCRFSDCTICCFMVLAPIAVVVSVTMFVLTMVPSLILQTKVPFPSIFD